ncbi:MAG: IgGFc-binding protein [Paludibacteraceae bacterium]|nr:IgGFc-binding protein [Paludibacteraceae bacterium]
MSSPVPSNVSIYEGYSGVLIDSFTFVGDTVWNLTNPSLAYLNNPDIVSGKSIKVVSSSPLSLFMANSTTLDGDASFVLPASLLGREYVVQSFSKENYATEFAVVATEPGVTSVTIESPIVTMTSNGAPRAPYTPYVVSLNQGQVYYGTSYSPEDLSGTHICADRNIAVFSGNQNAFSRKKTAGTSQLSHQSMPLKYWGKRFALGKTAGQSHNYVELTAVDSSTIVYLNGAPVDTIDSYETSIIDWNDVVQTMFIETSKPVICYQYMVSQGDNAQFGAPAMALVSPLELASNEIRFMTFGGHDSSCSLVYHVNVFAPTSSLSDMLLDSANISSYFSPMLGLSGYSFAQIAVSSGSHVLSNNSGRFVTLIYGETMDESCNDWSYAYNSGSDLLNLNAYMLIDGERIDEYSVCESADGKWHVDFQSVINERFDSVRWYDVYNGETRLIGSDTLFQYAFDDSLMHDVMMVVYREEQICRNLVSDTVTARVFCAETFDVFRDEIFACFGDTIFLFNGDDTLLTDTMSTYVTYHYQKRYNTSEGCDSLVHETLFISNPQDELFEHEMCQGDSYSFHGKSYYNAGRYVDTLYENGCMYESVLELTVHPRYDYYDTIEICDVSVPYIWSIGSGENSYVLSNSCDTSKMYSSVYGCDSVYHLHFMVHDSYFYDDTVVLCQSGLPYVWTGHKSLQFDSSGIYFDSCKTSFGCDSIYRLSLVVYESFSDYDYDTICSNETYRWQGNEYSGLSGGVYNFQKRYVSRDGCDSISYLQLTVFDTIIIETVRKICEYDSIIWDGEIYSGTKFNGITDHSCHIGDTIFTHSFSRVRTGCDSIHLLRLTVSPSYDNSHYDTLCVGDSILIGRRGFVKFTLAGDYDYVDSFVTIRGCDSVEKFYVHVNPIYSFHEQATVCVNESYSWRGKLYENLRPGKVEFTDSFLTDNGCRCDSVYFLSLTVLDTVSVYFSESICDDDSILWKGTVYKGSQCKGGSDGVVLPVGTHDIINRYTSERTGCDSVVHLYLSVLPKYEFHRYDTTCQGSDYRFNYFPLIHCSSIGDYDYYDTIPNRYGCDSVEILHLHVLPVYSFVDSLFLCDDKSISWHGQFFNDMWPGTYEHFDSLKAIDGCDSVYKLVLTVGRHFFKSEELSLCANSSLMWRGREFSGDDYSVGDYLIYDSLTTHDGCDSIYELSLHVHNTDYTDLGDITVCMGDSFRLCTKVYWCDEPGTFHYCDTMPNRFGCDSVVKVNVIVYPTFLSITRDTICFGENYSWREHFYNSPQVPGLVEEDRYIVGAGCDSVYRLMLTVLPSYFFRDVIHVCEGDTIIWHGMELSYNRDGIYVIDDKMITNSGCDSIYELTLFVHPKYYINDVMHVCEGDTVQYLSHTIDYPAGQYVLIDTLSTVYGCDSVVQMMVYVHPSYHFLSEPLWCSSSGVFNWRGRKINQSGVYFDSLKTVGWGCDSVYELRIDIQPSYFFERWDTICDNSGVYFQNEFLKDEGDHYFNYRTINGCDSVYCLHLKVNRTYWNDIYVTLCGGDSIYFAGRFLKDSGIYGDTTYSVHGCDSVDILHLRVNPSYYRVVIDSITCSNDTFSFNGRNYTKSGIYIDSMKTELGCDSIVELRLNMIPAYRFETDTAVCDFKPYVWRHRSFTQSGVYYDSLKSSIGCDSVYVLYISFVETLYDTIYRHSCTGEAYLFGGRQLTKSGIYNDTICSPRGFDCRVVTLVLDFVDPSVFAWTSVADVCADDLSFTIDHVCGGTPPLSYSVLFTDDAHNQGFRDVIDAVYDGNIVVDIPNSDSHQFYVRPDNYVVTVRLNNGICDPAGSDYQTNVLVKWPSWVTEQKWQDVVAVLNDKNNGGYTFDLFEWYVNGKRVAETRGSYIYLPNVLAIGDEVYVNLRREGESYTISSCPLTIVDRLPLQVSTIPFMIYPSHVRRTENVTMRSDVPGHYVLSDCAGHVLSEGDFNDAGEIVLPIPYVSGVYMVSFRTDDGRYIVEKIVVNE